MMRILALLFVFACYASCAQDKQQKPATTAWQKQMNADFKDATKSPLKAKDLKNFKGLDFYPFDSTYVVKAKFVRTQNAKSFKMKTTRNHKPTYVKYGELSFTLKNVSYKLNIYQNLGLIKKEGYEDYLFLPFLDNTNGNGSYAGGRYIECSIPKNNEMIIDFNKAYNPYCAYNEKYSCPIVPRENYLNTNIEAGVKAFKK